MVDFDGFKITLSPKTETFFYLLEKNKKYKDKFISITKDIYFSELNLIDKKFIVSSSFP